ncbi:uncharacterized protein LOC125370458 [Ricinus communis]|uniref:uncharacterized protein LOC125370458 n=1 Tax=Ricinus communis TaxID=3988 RepID=UPI00201B33EF|nr:uncharacterized protein LOC125370458 [Ricinus communis]
MPLPPYTCGATQIMADFYSMNKLMQFLMGLNDCRDNTRNQILVMDPLLSVNRVYSMLLRVEKLKEVHVNFNKNADAIGLLAKIQGNFKSVKKEGAGRNNFRRKEKERQTCEHCSMKGRTKEECFKLHGYPDWYKELKGQQRKTGGKAMVNMADSPLDLNSDDGQVEIASLV